VIGIGVDAGIVQGIRYVGPNNGWRPTDHSAIHSWWDYSDVSSLTLSSAEITGVTDLSGNGHDLTSAADKYPDSLPVGPYGLFMARFDGVDEYMEASGANWDNFTDIHQYGIHMVVTVQETFAAGPPIHAGVHADNRFLLYTNTSGDLIVFRGGSASTSASRMTQGTLHYLWHRGKSGQQPAVQCDDDYELLLSAGTDTQIGFRIAAHVDFSYYSQLDVGEIVVVDEDDNTSRTELEEYFAWKWGVTTS